MTAQHLHDRWRLPHLAVPLAEGREPSPASTDGGRGTLNGSRGAVDVTCFLPQQ